jgi:anti-sigma-K factor RskA
MKSRSTAQMLIGVSRVCRGLAEVPQRYLEAHQALRRSNPDRPIVSLSELSPFEHLVASADRSTRTSIAMEANSLTENGNGALMETLRAYWTRISMWRGLPTRSTSIPIRCATACGVSRS